MDDGLSRQALDVLSERVGWLPVAYVPDRGSQAFGCGRCRPRDLERAIRIAADGDADPRRPVLVGRDEWARVFPLDGGDSPPPGAGSRGVVVVLGRMSGAAVPLAERAVGLLGGILSAAAVASVAASGRGNGRPAGPEARTGAVPADVSRRMEELEVERTVHDQLRRALAEGASGGHALGRLVATLAEIVGAPAVLQTESLVVVAASGDTAAGLALAPSRHRTARDVVRPLASARGAVELPATGQCPPRLVAPVWGSGELLGFITVGLTGRPDTQVARAIECAAELAALERLIRAGAEGDRELDRDNLVSQLVAGHALPRLSERARDLGYDLTRPLVPCVFPLSSPDGAPAVRRAVTDAVRGVRGDAGDVLVGSTGDAVVALLPEDLPGGALSLCRALGRGPLSDPSPLRAGIGPVCQRVEDHPAAIAKARWVTEVLDVLDGSSAAARFEDLGVYSLLFDSQRAGELDEFVARWLGPVIAYDELHKGDLVGTLRCWLDTAGVMKEAAGRLHLHISTLKYRMQRISELVGVEDLRDSAVAFNLQLASKILEVRSRLGDSGVFDR